MDELVRLSKVADLSRWVVNIADPLFGWPRAWRREVLEGIIKNGLAPRQFWTLTRLRLMQKGNTPEKYLFASTPAPSCTSIARPTR